MTTNKKIHLTIGFILISLVHIIAQINSSFSPSKTSGIAPLAVLFDASKTTASGTDAFHDLCYEWNFGDSRSGSWSSANQSKNKASGPIAGHLFTNAGEYTVTLTVSDGRGTTRKSTRRIRVTNPDTEYAGDKTVCFSQQGSFAGKPNGAREMPANSTFSDVIVALNEGKRVLLKRGDTWNVNNGLHQIKNISKGILGAFGSGNAPLITTNTSEDFFVLNTVSNLIIQDIRLEGNANNAFTSGHQKKNTDVTWYKVSMKNFKKGINLSPHNASSGSIFPRMSIIECSIQNGNGGSGGNGVFIGSEQFLFLGNSISDMTRVEHCARFPFLNKAVIGYNRLSRPASKKHVIKLHGGSFSRRGASSTFNRASEKVVITRNTLDAGSGNSGVDWSLSIGPESSRNNEPVKDVLIIGNSFRNAKNAHLQISASKITVRNNTFQSLSNPEIRVFQRGIEDPPTNIHVYNNSGISSTDVSLEKGVSAASNITINKKGDPCSTSGNTGDTGGEGDTSGGGNTDGDGDTVSENTDKLELSFRLKTLTTIANGDRLHVTTRVRNSGKSTFDSFVRLALHENNAAEKFVKFVGKPIKKRILTRRSTNNIAFIESSLQVAAGKYKLIVWHGPTLDKDSNISSAVKVASSTSNRNGLIITVTGGSTGGNSGGSTDGGSSSEDAGGSLSMGRKLSTPITVKENASYQASTRVRNAGRTTFSGFLRLALHKHDAAETFVRFIGTAKKETVGVGKTSSTISIKENSFKATPGKYKVILWSGSSLNTDRNVSKAKKIASAGANKNGITLTVTGTTTGGGNTAASLSMGRPLTSPASVKENTIYQASTRVRNAGNATFSGFIRFALHKNDAAETFLRFIGTAKKETVGAGKTSSTISIKESSFKATPGKYKVILWSGSSLNTDRNVSKAKKVASAGANKNGISLTITSGTTGSTSGESLSMGRRLSAPLSVKKNGRYQVSTRIRNTGKTTFSGFIRLALHKNDASETFVRFIGNATKKETISSGRTSSNLIFKENKFNTASGKYKIILWHGLTLNTDSNLSKAKKVASLGANKNGITITVR